MTESATTATTVVDDAAPAASLFSPITLGRLELPNRIVMAPLTRRRAHADGTPSDLMVRHYADRATAGLIIAEGTFLSHRSRTYLNQPGLATDEHVAGWRQVTDAVHEAGGRITVQLMHGGRVAMLPDAEERGIVAPSALPVGGERRLPDGTTRPHATPRALATDEVGGVVAEFADAARRAIDAGFDGVEIHGANGYLLQQFLAASTNHRDDAYGGSPANRARLVVEVTRAVADAVGADRTALRLSPGETRQGLEEHDSPDVAATYAALNAGIAGLGLAYLHVLSFHPDSELVQGIRRDFGGPFVINSGFEEVTTRAEAERFLVEDLGDAVAVGRPLLANPDLVRRWREGRELNAPDPATFYTPGEVGYNDYPFLED